jgi:cell division protein FtsB
MVVRTRLRAVLLPLLLYVVSGGVTGYFVDSAVNGGRGLRAKEVYRIRMAKLGAQLTDLTGQRDKLQRRVDMMSSENVDRDLLEEEVRTQLGLVRSSDVVVFLPRDAAPAP